MEFRKSLETILNVLKTNDDFRDQIVHWHTIPPKEGELVEMPVDLDHRLKLALENRGFHNCIHIKVKPINSQVEGITL